MDVVRKEGANRTPSGLDGRHPCCGNNRLHPSAAGNTYAIRFHPTFLDGPVTFHLVTTFHLDTFHPVLLFRTSHRADQEDICLFFLQEMSRITSSRRQPKQYWPDWRSIGTDQMVKPYDRLVWLHSYEERPKNSAQIFLLKKSTPQQEFGKELTILSKSSPPVTNSRIM